MARRRRFFRAPWFPNPNRPQTSKLVGRTVGIGLVLAASNAIAQAPKQEDVPLPPVDVTGQRRGDYRVPQASDPFRLPDLLKDTPQSITVVPQEILKEQAAFTLQDALRNVTGISLAAGEGGVQGDNLTLRGFPARTDLFKGDVLTDKEAHLAPTRYSDWLS